MLNGNAVRRRLMNVFSHSVVVFFASRAAITSTANLWPRQVAGQTQFQSLDPWKMAVLIISLTFDRLYRNLLAAAGVVHRNN